MSAGRPNAYRQADTQIVIPHARHAWNTRTQRPGYNLRLAWREAQPIEYPSARATSYARYHDGEDVVLIARLGFLRTVIDLDDRPDHEQQRVYQQL